MGLTTYADYVRVTSITTEPVHTMLPWTLRWMKWHKTQRSKNILSSLQVNVPDSTWLPLTARGSFWHDRIGGSVPWSSPRHYGFNSVFGSGIPSLAIPGLRTFGPLYLGSWAKYDEKKSDNWYETGKMAQKKKRIVDRRKVWDFLGLVLSATELHARRLQWYQNLMKDPTAHQNVVFLLWRSFF